jgi:transcriptional regulator with GAF, ATPase, and Fis domain
MPKLEIFKDKHFWKEYVFPDSDVLVIGRTQSSDIVLPDSTRTVSRYHAAIVRVGDSRDQYFVRDLGSLHGTTICGVPIYQRVLADGDVIQIAMFRLVYSTTAQAQSRQRHLRVVSKKTFQLLPETSTIGFDPLGAPEGAPLPPDRLELLEQLQHKVGRGVRISDVAEELVAAVLRVLHADRGFIGLFREGHPGLYHETGLVNLRPEEAIEISDTTFADRLAQGSMVSEGATLLCPIPAGEKVIGFLCVSRRDPSRVFSSSDASFVFAVGKLIPHWTEGERAEKPEATGAMEWPVAIVGKSGKMAELSKQIEAAAATEMNVLILGETGTGKELVARAIHQQSSHPDGPFVARNCGQTTETLAETEIFGYAPKSGIAGANPQGAKGWFEEANGGTLFLDEVHRLTPAMQDKFLRVLQDKAVSRFGRAAAVPVDVKVLAATDEDLERAVQDGSFRRPFYYRFGVKIYLPPLRERREDIPILVYYFLDKYAKKLGSRTRAISHRALRELLDYDWPGNVRQLEQIVQAGVAKNQEILFSWDFQEQLGPATPTAKAETAEDSATRQGESKPAMKAAAPKSMDEVEKEKIKEALEVTQGNATRAAELLGYKSRQTILNKMDRYGIPRNYADPQAVHPSL